MKKLILSLLALFIFQGIGYTTPITPVNHAMFPPPRPYYYRPYYYNPPRYYYGKPYRRHYYYYNSYPYTSGQLILRGSRGTIILEGSY